MAEEVERESSASVPVIKESISVERHDGPVTLKLLDAGLWHAFRQEGTEMIITKAGRRMFPFVMITVEGLSPTLLYSVHLSLVPCDNCQYKFCQRRWVSVSDSAPGPTPTPEQPYIHPASPNRGSFWCQETISFAKLKITNNKHSSGDIVLQSMRKYMAQITVREDLGDVQYVFTLPETTFVAVTQYQNEAVTRMKIAHNPFANGFKYAHVTGGEDGKKIFSRSDLSRSQDSKYKFSLSGSKSNTKTARVKATVTPQTFTPILPVQHREEDMKLADQALPLTLPTPVQPHHHLSSLFAMKAGAESLSSLSLQQEPGIFPGGFPVPSTVAISPYIFQSDDSETVPDINGNTSVNSELEVDVEICSPDADECLLAAGEDCSESDQYSHKKDSDGEDRDGCVSDGASATVLVSPTQIPTVITDAEETVAENSVESTVSYEENNSLKDLPLTVLSSSTGELQTSSQPSSGTATYLMRKGETFKQPLPRKSTVFSKKHLKKSNEGSSSWADVNMHWYRNALHQASQRQQESPIKQDRGVQLKLHDSHIWHSFAACGSKMVISAEGRNMFPVISISLRGLDPGRLYSVWLHLTAADDMMYSYPREQGMWGSLFPARRPTTSVKPYMHPSSPMRGLAWMKVKITFDDVKLTSDPSSTEEGSALPLQCGRRYLTQVVVREEEEVTPNGVGGTGDIFFFPLPELTFMAWQDNDEVKPALSLTSRTTCTSETRKRPRDDTSDITAEDPDESESAAAVSSKAAKVELVQNPWLRPPVIFPRSSDLSSMMPGRVSDMSAILSRQSELHSRLNPVYCFPPMSTLPPAHVGLFANRMPLPVASPLQSIASFPFHPQLFPQLRSPMHSAFGFALPPFNPFPYLYYPYSVPSVTPTSSVSDVCKGLDLSLKQSDSG